VTDKTAATEMLQLQGVVKRYGNFTAVAGIDLDVHRGEIFGFLGPNGAGKTTTLWPSSWTPS
jgi:ABC-type multidrug transport system ATPase subunit